MTAGPATSPRSPVRPLAAALWLALSLAALTFTARQRYAVGLDFAGGTLLELAPLAGQTGGCDTAAVEAWLRAGAAASQAEVEARVDTCRVQLPGFTDEARLDALVASLPTATNHSPGLREAHRFVVRSTYAPAFGPPLVEGIGWAAAFAWVAAVALRSRVAAVLAVAMTTFAAGLAWLLWLGATLGLAVELAALWFAPALAWIAWSAAAPHRSTNNLVRAWPGWLALALLWGAAETLQALDPVSAAAPRWPYVGARLAQTLILPVIVLALLAAWTLRAAPPRGPTN